MRDLLMLSRATTCAALMESALCCGTELYIRACTAIPSTVEEGIWRTYDNGSSTSMSELSQTTALLTSKLPSLTTGVHPVATSINAHITRANLKYILVKSNFFVSLAS